MTTTVLHVDGDPDFLETSAAALEARTDWAVRTATTADAGQTCLEDEAVDCVVSEYALPEIDGVEFLEAVRAEWPDLPFIIFTASGSESIASDAISAGVTDYIQKGTGEDQYSELADRIETAVTQSRTTQNLDQTQADQRESERDERFREIAELSPDGIFRTDTSGRFTYVSPASEAMLDAPASELLGTCFEEFVTPESATDALEGFSRVVDGETVTQLELRLVDSDGEPFDAEVSATPIKRDGETVHVQGFARDVTARKQRERDLQHSRHLFDQLVANFPNGGVFLVDQDLRFTVVGGDELELGGLSPAAMLGKRPSEVFPPENASLLEENYRAALNGETRSFEDSFQGRHYHDQMVPIRDTDGEVVAALSIAQNITRRVEDKAELERQNRRLDEFASAVSHDLRGPLNVAQGRVELARKDCDSDQLDPIASAHHRMEELIDSLLSLARQGQTVGETTVLDLETVVEECWATVRTDDCRLEVEGTCQIRADESRFRQLFENLARNAVEHGADTGGSTPLTVRVGALPDGFYVEDDGPGVDDGRLDTIFERSVTTKSQGTGFGLAMVREIVDAHGWTIAATDSAEGGFRVEVTDVSLVE